MLPVLLKVLELCYDNDMKANLRSRNIGINSYIGIFIVTLVGTICSMFLLHIIYEAPLKVFASPDLYQFDTK
jgi:hypothetical protein